MKKSLFLILFIALFTLCYASGNIRHKIIVRITGADGRKPITAHIHLSQQQYGYMNPLKTIEMDKKGIAKLEIYKEGLYFLFVTAVDHETLKIPIYLSKKETKVKIKVRLSPYSYKDSLDDIYIAGSWDDFSYNKMKKMGKNSDGTYSITIHTEDNEIGYQLHGLVSSERIINGPKADYYKYDGGGDYRSYLKVKPGEVTIIFDPKKLKRYGDKNLPLVVFKNSSKEKFYEILHKTDEFGDNLMCAVREYNKSEDKDKKFEFDFDTPLNFLRDKMKNDNNSNICKFAAFELGFIHGFYTNIMELSTFDAEDILKVLPVESPFYRAHPILPVILLSTLERQDELLEFYEKNPSKLVKAYSLIFYAYHIQSQGNIKKLREVYEKIKGEFGNLKEIKSYLIDLNPDKKIMEGKDILDFKVKLFNKDEYISNESLKGKYYLLDFWATWCSPCIAELPNLRKVYEKYKGKNFEILSISLDEDKEKVKTFISKNKMEWLNTIMDNGWNNPIVKKFEVFGIPSTILVDSTGKIIATNLRGESLIKTLEKYLK